jgi:hypothetical protein
MTKAGPDVTDIMRQESPEGLPRSADLDSLRQRRAELVRALESLIDGKDAYPRVTLEREIAALSAAINRIDRELALSPPRRMRRQAA